MLPKISEVGKLVADPELRYVSSGAAVCNLRLVFSKRKKTENGGWVDDKVIFLSGALWEKYAEHAAESLNKGDSVLVSGALYQRDWEDKEGNKRTSIEMDIYDIGPVLKWGPAKIARAERLSQTGTLEDDPWQTGAVDDSTEPPPF